MKKSTLAAAFALAALALAGCSEATSDTADKTGSNASVAPAEEAKDSGVLEFGETVNYDDGLSITVGKPEKFKPTEWAAYDKKAPAHVKFKVTIVNGTEEPFDATLVYASVQSGDTEATEVFDSDQMIGETPQTQLLPGRQASYWIGYGITNPQDIVLEISDALAHDAAIFTNAA